jgi:hypothetical protein
VKNLNISTRIWLSIGIFILGFVMTTALHQIQGRDTENNLQTASESLFPAAQKTQEAEAAFNRAVKEFGDAVISQDSSGVDRAAESGRSAVLRYFPPTGPSRPGNSPPRSKLSRRTRGPRMAR